MSVTPLVFVWLDKRLGYLPGGNEKLKDKFRRLLTPIRQFDKPMMCYDFIRESTKEKNVFFLTSFVFAEEEFLRRIAAIGNVINIYIYDPDSRSFSTKDQLLNDKLGPQRVIHFDELLYEQLITDLVKLSTQQAEQLIKDKQSKPAKQLLESALRLIETCDEINGELESVQRDLSQRLERL